MLGGIARPNGCAGVMTAGMLAKLHNHKLIAMHGSAAAASEHFSHFPDGLCYGGRGVAGTGKSRRDGRRHRFGLPRPPSTAYAVPRCPAIGASAGLLPLAPAVGCRVKEHVSQ